MDLGENAEIEDVTLIGEISTKNSARKVWLVKVPDFLAELWKTQSPGTHVGELKFLPTPHPPRSLTASAKSTNNNNNNNTNQTINTRISLNQNQTFENKPIPTDFKMTIRSAEQLPMVLFSEKDRNLRVEGKVSMRGDFVPEKMSTQYRALQEMRIEKANTLKNSKKTEILPHTLDMWAEKRIQREKAEQLKKRKVEKQPQMDPEQLEETVFNLFENTKLLDLKTIQEKTGQSAEQLKGVLSEICDQIKTGENKNKYKLKELYNVD